MCQDAGVERNASREFGIRLTRFQCGGQDSLIMFDYIMGGIVALALLIYLCYALARPERF